MSEAIEGKRLQIRHTDGTWRWLFCREECGQPVTTPDKHKALGDPYYYGEDDLNWARQMWPDREFRLAETLDEPTESSGRQP